MSSRMGTAFRPASSPGCRITNSMRRATEGAVSTEAKVPASEGETSIVVIKGASRFQVPWSSDDTASALRQRVEAETGIPPEKQELQLASQELLDQKCSGLLEAMGQAKGPFKVWLTDLRTPAEIRAALKEQGREDELPEEEYWTPSRTIVTAVVTFVILDFFASGKPLADFLVSGGAPIKPPK